VAEESGAYLIDADKLVMLNHVKGVNNTHDWYHLTDAGNKYLADLIAEEVRQIMLKKHPSKIRNIPGNDKLGSLKLHKKSRTCMRVIEKITSEKKNEVANSQVIKDVKIIRGSK
jgi:hypothetical protein